MLPARVLRVVGIRGLFCRSLEIDKEGGVYDIKYDIETLDEFSEPPSLTLSR